MKKGLADYQVKQMNEKNRKREEELIMEMEEAERIKKAVEDDEKVYRSYAERCVNEWGANVREQHTGLIFRARTWHR